ncbi:MAG: helix-turn-helix transcriptional regulator [Myxococcota bacterium]
MATPNTEHLRNGDVRRLLSLLVEVIDVPELERPAHLIGSLRQMIGADVGGCLIDYDFAPDGRGALAAVVMDNWDAATLRVIEAVSQRGSAFNPGLLALMQACPMRPGAIMTGERQHLVEDRGWYGTPYVEDFMLPAHLDHGLFSAARGAEPSVVQGIGFFREKGARPFDEGDRAIVHVFHLECARLLRPRTPVPNEVLRAQLTPRARGTLALLLEGHADKEIAARLAISPFTVNQYSKVIYRKFDVHSRAALIAKLGSR